jgi:exosortase
MAAMACCWVGITGSRSKWPVVVALFALSLPVIASLQFYAGYPLRTLTAAGASLLLKPFGLDVERVGTAMLWEGRAVLVDAPCSGVRMLWAGAFLACVLASQRTWVSWRSLAAGLLLMIPVALIANSVRAAALFVLETRAEPVPQFLHASVGVAIFALAGAAMLVIDPALRNREPGTMRWSAAWRR